VIDLEKGEHNRLIVESTARLAHALGMQIVAEGVETAWVRDYLTEIGYNLGQGYLFSRPLEAADCFAWLSAYNAPRQRAG
jgi:EAL domain-containing protein (putative c-di-GMP-specific phosphodiesterase class I)